MLSQETIEFLPTMFFVCTRAHTHTLTHTHTRTHAHSVQLQALGSPLDAATEASWVKLSISSEDSVLFPSLTGRVMRVFFPKCLVCIE